VTPQHIQTVCRTSGTHVSMAGVAPWVAVALERRCPPPANPFTQDTIHNGGPKLSILEKVVASMLPTQSTSQFDSMDDEWGGDGYIDDEGGGGYSDVENSHSSEGVVSDEEESEQSI
jgi:hypothetical protein